MRFTDFYEHCILKWTALVSEQAGRPGAAGPGPRGSREPGANGRLCRPGRGRCVHRGRAGRHAAIGVCPSYGALTKKKLTPIFVCSFQKYTLW